LHKLTAIVPFKGTKALLNAYLLVVALIK